ncbi:TonB family protein [Pedobacter sp. MC2016-24]|uniref:TonB family protein n=1 Tax=Pedobacter sp. MC2016-24 TaxID=2780090 RepID=UPI001880BDEE|nr:TonB family protein [Pedobacter sp. MC2016-24]MBE9600528.1 TonB family protein [Pedobacter sp. MC2016-24]
MAKILTLFLTLCFLDLAAQTQPQLKGGLAAFVANNKVYPGYSMHNCIEGTVTISFKLNQKGEVYYSKIRTGMGTDLDDEALRLIRLSSGKWQVPAGHDTTVSLVAPIKFTLEGYNCGDKNQAEIRQAIAAYRSNEGATNTILNFYRNKEAGTFKEGEEPRILALKKELGYDDVYLQERVDDGLKKVKQKDMQGACEDFRFVKYMGSDLANEALAKYCQ